MNYILFLVYFLYTPVCLTLEGERMRLKKENTHPHVSKQPITWMEYTDRTLIVRKNNTFIVPDSEEGVIIWSEMEKRTTIVCWQLWQQLSKGLELYWKKRAGNHWPVLKGIYTAT